MQPSEMERITFRITPTQKSQIEALVESGEYPNRSEAIRAAVRDMLTEDERPTDPEVLSEVVAPAESP